MTTVAAPVDRPRHHWWRDRRVAPRGTVSSRQLSYGPEKEGFSAGPRLLAPALLLMAGMGAACINPNYVGKPVPLENHTPVVEAFPAPTFEPLAADVGGDCAPLTFDITRLEDADGDTLTVRFDIVLRRQGRATRVELRESPPLRPDQDGVFPLGTALTTLELNEDLLGARLGDLDAQMDPANNNTQLIELRVSDAGFVADENGDPVVDGEGGLVFLSWLVRLTECEVAP